VEGGVTFSIRALEPGAEDAVVAAATLFDHEPQRAWTMGFLSDPGHHLLMASVDGEPAGFVTEITVRHPDKAPEMLLYELGVAERFRRRGIGTALVTGLRDVTRRLGHRSMWVPSKRKTRSPPQPIERPGQSGGNQPRS
jgi:GNAT superfamily N-acetyltransferase